jgi:hypothetical protein
MRWRIILLTMWLTSCGSDEKPKNLIDEGTMVNIMAEIHLIEADINHFHFQSQDTAIFVYQKLKVKMLKKYNLDTATFNSSFKYYVVNPDKLKLIYVEVKKKLEDDKKKTLIAAKTKPKVSAKLDSAKRKSDSIQTALHKPNIAFLEKLRAKNIAEEKRQKKLHSLPEYMKKNAPKRTRKELE